MAPSYESSVIEELTEALRPMLGHRLHDPAKRAVLATFASKGRTQALIQAEEILGSFADVVISERLKAA